MRLALSLAPLLLCLAPCAGQDPTVPVDPSVVPSVVPALVGAAPLRTGDVASAESSPKRIAAPSLEDSSPLTGRTTSDWLESGYFVVDSISARSGASPVALEAGAASSPLPPGGAPPVPEPSTLLLVGTGLIGVALTSRLTRRRSQNS